MQSTSESPHIPIPFFQSYGLNGTRVLYDLLERSPYGSVAQAVASLTAFTHPQAVALTCGMNVFLTVRNMAGRGEYAEHPACGRVMQDDNYSPTVVFLWANGLKPPRGVTMKGHLGDVQFNHVWTRSQDARAYTSLANICMTPSFLAKLTDTDRGIQDLLRYRAYALYGYVPDGELTPTKPNSYDALQWCLPVPAVADVETAFRTAMRIRPKDRVTRSARELGWYFSDFQPDTSL